jgi:hypothetical protein
VVIDQNIIGIAKGLQGLNAPMKIFSQ